jgi:guanyl-specific ribonuclease Sa
MPRPSDGTVCKDAYSSAGGVAADDSITTTTEHPFWVEGAGFVRAADLRAGDVLGSRRARAPSPVLAVVSRDDDVSGPLVVKATTVRGRGVTPWAAFNLTVAQDHTFFVGASKAWVHNCITDFDVKRLPQGQQDSVFDTLSHINSGTVPTGPTGKRWGIPFENREGHLPLKDADGNLIDYFEYRVAPVPGAQGAGTERIVTGTDGARYYTGTHYGTADFGVKPFVRIKKPNE